MPASPPGRDGQTNRLIDTLVMLVDAGVEFVVCGGIACILQGVDRATHDLDVYATHDDENLAKLIAVAKRLGLQSRIPEPIEALANAERRQDWIERKRAVVFTLRDESGLLQIDVFLRYPVPAKELLEKADTMQVRGRQIRVSCKKHLIAAKEAIDPPRKSDLRDLADLRELLDDSA